MPKSTAERKAAERARKRAAGFRPGEVWARPTDWPEIRSLERQLRQKISKKQATAQATENAPVT